MKAQACSEPSLKPLLKQPHTQIAIAWVRITTIKNEDPKQWIRVKITPQSLKIHLYLLVKHRRTLGEWRVNNG